MSGTTRDKTEVVVLRTCQAFRPYQTWLGDATQAPIGGMSNTVNFREKKWPAENEHTVHTSEEIQSFLGDLESDTELSDLSDESEEEGNYCKFCLCSFYKKYCLLEEV